MYYVLLYYDIMIQKRFNLLYLENQLILIYQHIQLHQMEDFKLFIDSFITCFTFLCDPQLLVDDPQPLLFSRLLNKMSKQTEINK